jgi:diguanylate cyclase (GGDEF)-like protein
MSFRQLLTPSFRSRLRLFFVVIVIVPMIAVAAVLWWLIVRSETSQTDARLSEARHVAAQTYTRLDGRAGRVAQRIGGEDQRLADAIAAGERGEIQGRLSELRLATGSRYVELRLAGQAPFVSGRRPALATAERRLQDDQSRALGRLTVSEISPEAYADDVSELTEADVVIKRGDEVITETLTGVVDVRLPERGEVMIDGDEFRASPAIMRDGFAIQLVLRTTGPSPWSVESLVLLGIFLAFLALAFAFAFAVTRRLHAEIQRLLQAAQRLGAGDFSVAVPAEGNDEFGALGKEFNSMARQLAARLEELQRERARLQDAIRRVGESFAKGLDRVGLLEVVVQTAVDGTGASCGRATMRTAPDDHLREVARAGDPQPFRRSLHAAEAAVMDAGQLAEIQVAGVSALAAPLGANEEGTQVIGVISVARGDRAFTAGERELFAYLTNQASVSVENVDLHETVQRQAVTDELTGLFNHRRFQEVMAVEVERARRYGHEMGLIMLDIDNFKQVNDRHGHLQGDLVLRQVARVLRQSSREIDEPARYGGEEMAVALPQTDLEGAYQFAERVRRRIEALELPLPNGAGVLQVTASFGVASLGAAGDTDKDALVAAADGALYEAKRTGKNRTVRAPAGAVPPRDVHGVASTE